MESFSHKCLAENINHMGSAKKVHPKWEVIPSVRLQLYILILEMRQEIFFSRNNHSITDPKDPLHEF